MSLSSSASRSGTPSGSTRQLVSAVCGGRHAQAGAGVQHAAGCASGTCGWCCRLCGAAHRGITQALSLLLTEWHAYVLGLAALVAACSARADGGMQQQQLGDDASLSCRRAGSAATRTHLSGGCSQTCRRSPEVVRKEVRHARRRRQRTARAVALIPHHPPCRPMHACNRPCMHVRARLPACLQGRSPGRT